MTQQNLKPDEIVMLERAEKATKGPWKRGKKAVSRCPLCDGEGEVDSIDINGDGWTALALTYGIGQMIEDNAAFIKAARTDLPTILTRLANERAKLAIAMEALESARLAIRQGAAQEARNITEDALCRINELEEKS